MSEIVAKLRAMCWINPKDGLVYTDDIGIPGREPYFLIVVDAPNQQLGIEFITDGVDFWGRCMSFSPCPGRNIIPNISCPLEWKPIILEAIKHALEGL